MSTALLGILTSLPWYTGFSMPEDFTAVLVLCMFLLAFCPERLSSGQLRCFPAARTRLRNGILLDCHQPGSV